MDKKLIKNALIFGAGLYIGGMWVKAKVMEAFMDEVRKDIPEKKGPIHYKPYHPGYTKYKVREETEFIFANRKDAEQVLSEMDAIVKEYGRVTVADIHDLVGSISNYMDNKKGWTDIRDARVMKLSNGYTLMMPKMVKF